MSWGGGGGERREFHGNNVVFNVRSHAAVTFLSNGHNIMSSRSVSAVQSPSGGQFLHLRSHGNIRLYWRSLVCQR